MPVIILLIINLLVILLIIGDLLATRLALAVRSRLGEGRSRGVDAAKAFSKAPQGNETGAMGSKNPTAY